MAAASEAAVTRHYAQIDCSIWDDEDGFCTLSAGAQRTYFMLVSQKDISACGLLPLTLRRWARNCTENSVDVWLKELADGDYILIDEDREEVLVRTFVKYDGGYKHSKRLLAVLSAVDGIRSPTLRHSVEQELIKLGVSIANPVAFDRESEGNAVPSGSGRVVVTEVSTNHNPQSADHNPHPGSQPAQKRGTRLEADWRPDEATRLWTLERLPQQTAATELEKFRNYWIAKTGKDATKLDWDRTWRNWVMNSNHAPPGQQQPVGKASQKAAAWLSLGNDQPDQPAIEGWTA